MTRSGTNCTISIIPYWVIIDPSSTLDKVHWSSSFLSSTNTCLRIMDRPSTSINPLFDEQEDDPNNYVTKAHLFGVQRALHQESEALGDRIEQLATDLRHSETRTRDYFDAKLSSQMEELRDIMVTRTTSMTSSSRRRHSSRHSSDSSSRSSPSRARCHRRNNHDEHCRCTKDRVL